MCWRRGLCVRFAELQTVDSGEEDRRDERLILKSVSNHKVEEFAIFCN